MTSATASSNRSLPSRRLLHQISRTLLILAAISSLFWSLWVSVLIPFHFESGGSREILKSGGGDFSAYYVAGYCVAKGIPLYNLKLARQVGQDLGMLKGPPRYVYPPFIALFFVPMAVLMNVVTAYRVSMVAFTVLLWLSVVFLLRTLRVRPSLTRLSLVVVAVSWFTPCWTSIESGQIDMVALCLASLGLFAWSRFKPIFSGVIWAAASTMKLFPGLVIVYFAFRRHWQTLFAMILTIVVLASLSLVILGYDVHDQYIKEELPDHASRVMGGNHSVALNSLVYRLIHHRGLTPEIAASSTEGRNATLVGRLFLLLGGGFFLIFPRHDNTELGLQRLCLLLTTALMVNAWTWTHHLVMALPCLAVAGRRLLRGSTSILAPNSLLLILSYGLIAIGYKVQLESMLGLHGWIRELVRCSSLNFFGLFLLWLLLIRGIIGDRTETASHSCITS